MGFFLFAIFSDKAEVFLPKYSQTAILHAAHFQRDVKVVDLKVKVQYYIQPARLGRTRCLHVNAKVVQ